MIDVDKVPVADRLDAKKAQKVLLRHDEVKNASSIHLLAVDTSGVSTRLVAKDAIKIAMAGTN